ncbi:CRP-like cAMP-binding protein [Pedobacter africanus]|uniref:CRP-like cAMP-binding protein n=1 Tax=Pedobacter africanus TaxID=151894 RepID=A0ACC6KWP2_9SPHI|nr:Crp/Fnr family transcriptional regulator [Pedobacter africanus]MDR6783793.1 CRP-like cAMP-binding protein [Pedobacter africanus]
MTSHQLKIEKLTNSLDAPVLAALNAISITKTYNKSDFLLKEGDVCSKSFWIEEGIARKFYTNKDREITTEFYFKDDLAIAYESYTLQKPGREYIQALTELKVNTTDYASFQDLKKKYTELQELDFLMTEFYALWLEEKVFELHTQNATQRYQNLCAKSAHIIRHVPLTHIASYLNVSLETLSRIRAKI